MAVSHLPSFGTSVTPEENQRERQSHANREMQRYQAEQEVARLREKQSHPLYELRRKVEEWLNPLRIQN